MKMINRFSLLILVMGVSLSCSRDSILPEREAYPEYVYRACTEIPTRAVVQEDGQHVFWSPDDKIIVYKGNTYGLFTAQLDEPAPSASFSGSFQSTVNDSDPSLAVFPSTAAFSYKSGKLTVGVGGYQYRASSNSRVDKFVSIARTDGDTLRFHNLCGGISFSCSSYGITQISFTARGEVPISGKVIVGFDDDGIPTVSSFTSSRPDMVIKPDDGEECFIPGKRYYVPVIPCMLSQGYTLGVTAYGKAYSKVDTTPREIRRSVIAYLGNVDRFFDDWFTPEAVDLGLPSGVLWANVNYGAYFVDQFDFGSTDCTENTSISSWGYDAEGGQWRRPTAAEWEELQNECTWHNVEVQSILRGYEIRSRTKPGKTIFLHINPRNSNNLYWAGIDKCLSLELYWPFYGFSIVDANSATQGMIRPVCTHPATP